MIPTPRRCFLMAWPPRALRPTVRDERRPEMLSPGIIFSLSITPTRLTQTRYKSRKIRKFRTNRFDVKQTEVWAPGRPTGNEPFTCRLHESKLPHVSRIEFIRPKLSMFSAHVSGVIVGMRNLTAQPRPRAVSELGRSWLDCLNGRSQSPARSLR